MNIVSIILARGGSKGIPQKNIKDFLGKPLIAWTIEHCIKAGIKSVYVSSDSEEILSLSEKYGAKSIKRPEKLSGDTSSSESGWLHALQQIELENKKVDWVFAPQVTSPLRTSDDIRKGLNIAKTNTFDSLFSCCITDDLYLWDNKSGELNSINYNYKKRQRRQDNLKQYIENGSFYLFTPDALRKHNNRFGSQIGVVEMEFWKMFEIDTLEDFRICELFMKEFLS